MTEQDALTQAAIQVARVKCRQDEDGCNGPWCAAQGNIRRALEARGVEWRPEEPKADEVEDVAG